MLHALRYVYLAAAMPGGLSILWFGVWRPVLRGTYERED